MRQSKLARQLIAEAIGVIGKSSQRPFASGQMSAGAESLLSRLPRHVQRSQVKAPLDLPPQSARAPCAREPSKGQPAIGFPAPDKDRTIWADALLEDEVDWRLQFERIRTILARMKPKVRRVFLLRVARGWSYEQIAARCGMTQTGVEKHLLRAFEVLAEGAERERRAHAD